MTKREGKAEAIDIKALLERDEDFLRVALEALLQAALEVEMTEAIGAAKGERTAARLSYRSGYYGRSLVTRVGTLGLGRLTAAGRGRRCAIRSAPRRPRLPHPLLKTNLLNLTHVTLGPLPPLDSAEALEISMIYSVAGKLRDGPL